MKQFLFALILAFVGSSIAQASPLADYLRPRVKVLTRPMMTFHYSKDQAEPTDATEAFDQAAKVTRGFKNVDRIDANLYGPGLYVAPDPFASRSYSGYADPQLLVVTLKKGTRVLDMKTNPKDETLVELAKSVGCLYGFSRNIGSKVCHQSIIDIYAELNVQAVLFDYLSSSTLADCAKDSNMAINIIAASAIDEKTLSYFSKVKFDPAVGLGSFVVGLNREASKDVDLAFLRTVSQSSPLPDSLYGVAEMGAVEYTNMKKQFIWSCGEPWLGDL